MSESRSDKKSVVTISILIFISFFSLYSLTLQGVPTGGDAWGMFLVTRSMADNKSVFLEGSDRVVLRQGRDGRWVSKYGIGQSLAEIPAYLVSKLAARSDDPQKREDLSYFVTSFTSPIVSAGVCVLLFLLCIQAGYGRRVSAFMTVLLGTGSLLWPQSKVLFSEPLQAFCLTAAFLYTMKWRAYGGATRAAAAGFFCGLMVATKPFLAIAAPPLVIFFMSGLFTNKEKKRLLPAAAFFGALAFWGAVILYYNWARFGNAFEFGYLGGTDRDGVHGFNTPLLVGLHGLLFSSGKGLLFFTPAVVLTVAAWRQFAAKRRAEAWTIAATFALMLVSYSKWNAWHGDFTWGPRFLLPAVPLLILPIGDLFAPDGFMRRVSGKLLFAAVFCVSIFVQIIGVSVNMGEYLIMANTSSPYNGYFSPARVELRDNLLSEHYVPEYSQLSGHYWLLKNMVALRGDADKGRDKEMKNYPWRDIAPYSVHWSAASAARPDAWWYYISKYYPETRGWALSLAYTLLIMLFISGAALARAAIKSGGVET